jgi:predicted dithiol-disulfide oxidoreductase (DUF899 family)
MLAMRFPDETPEYRRARDELLRAEVALRRQIEAVAAQRRALPLGGRVSTDYEFDERDRATGAVRTVRLSELFDPGKDTLLIYSFMFNPGPTGRPLELPCPLCTSMIDGFEGGVPHLTQRINFAVATKAPIDLFAAHAHARGWRYGRLLSTAGSTYNSDYHAETSDADQRPMATVFIRRDSDIHHFWSSELLTAPGEPGEHARHVDFMWPLWAALDRTPDGRGADWMPQLAYVS